ncbi:MAG: DUF1846 family protein [Clostridia bacterium]|nr:DUF1846 family protein [Clostridia bacterium]
MEQFAFDNEKYKELQKTEIYDRIKKYGKLYIEVGGKLFDDNHAARCLPGFDPNVKMQIFKELKNDLEIIFCINARDIISRRTRSDNNLTYDEEVLRLIDCMNNEGISVCGVMINFHQQDPYIERFENKCKEINVPVYKTYHIEEYPNNIDKILSDDGFGKNDHIETHKNIVLVSAPGANSGKLVTCLSQLYNDKIRDIQSAYAKYETFPVWNLGLDDLVNVAYEMATADIVDINMVDPYYEKAYGKIATNYNRDVEAFPILSNMLNRINGHEIYPSPTDMGINNVGNAIKDTLAVQKASFAEIERRYYKNLIKYEEHKISDRVLERSNELYAKAKEIYKNLFPDEEIK